MVLKKLWLFFAAALVSACISLPINNNNTSNSNVAQPSNDIKSEESPKKLPPVLSMSQQEKDGYWDLSPRDGNMIIIGVSSRLSSQKDEIEAAKLDAARKLSMYYGIEGTFEILNVAGVSSESNSVLKLDYDSNYANYVDRLSYNTETDYLRGNGAVFIRMKANMPDIANIVHIPETKDDKPSWINNRDLPQYSGYTTVVGFSGNKVQLRDTIIASYHSAASQLIESASSTVSTNEGSVVGSASSSTVHISSKGRLSNFQVLEIWINPENKSVSTLAIARISK